MQARGIRTEVGSRRRRLRVALAALTAGVLLVPTLASAHLERPSYWPDPAPDRSVSPPAGGKVPKARSLASAVTGKGPGEVRVVCKGSSLKLAKRSIGSAQRRGFRLRPSQAKKRFSAKKARKMLKINRALFGECGFRSIQKAVNRSGNNDRVVIMPGRYREAKSRKAPTNDPRCDPSLIQQDQSGADTPSYEYQATCSNDQNLVYVKGRAIKGDPLATPRADRHGIPNQELGRCVRCNLQIEGSGARPEDVIIDAGRGYRKPKRPGSKPGVKQNGECAPVNDISPCYAKHVVLRTDRSDGFVGRNFTMRGALEHGFYTEETDGILLDKVKFFWAADYGHLSFTTDHNLIKNCDGYGSGDAVVYPGAAPQTGEFRQESFYPSERINTVIKRCDLHGSALAYSGSMGNSVRVTRNHIYGNTNGISSDTLSAPGHPGYPADGMQIDRNFIYSNNLNLYTADPPVDPLVPMPIGTAVVWPGMNDGRVHDNWIFDNWRHGTLLASVPDAVAGEPDGNVDSEFHCEVALPDLSGSTSCDNRYFGNRMGQVPAGFKAHPGLRKFGNETGLGDGAAKLPNGVDFWWDEFPGNTGNCWLNSDQNANIGPDGDRASLTGDPVLAPAAGVSLPGFLPEDCGSSVGSGDPVKEAILLDCSMWSRGNTTDDHELCYWFDMPAQPGSSMARAQDREIEREQREFARSDEAEALEQRLREIEETAFSDRP